MRTLLILTAAAILAVVTPARDVEKIVKPTLLADTDAVVPGSPFTLGLRLKIAEHWHTYWINPGETGEPTAAKLTGPAGFEFGQIQWPLPSRIEVDGGVAYGYEGEVLLLIPVKVAKDVPLGDRVTIRADITWLACKETCIPGQANLTIDLPVRETAKPDFAELFGPWRARLPLGKDAADDALAKVEQPTGASTLDLTWKSAPRKVEWFPISTNAVAIEEVAVKHDGASSRIEFKPKVFKAVPGNRVEGLLVYEDAAGKRIGVPLSANIAAAKP